MNTLGNFLWFIFGGLFSGILWLLAGLIWCITIIGIPIGLQCFKFASLVNVIWIVFFGLEMAVANLIIGCLWCITIIGIPFGKQFFKLAQLSLMPFGAQIVR